MNILILFTLLTLINSINSINFNLRRELQKGKQRKIIKGREREWLNEFEEWLYAKDILDFGNIDLYCEEGIGSLCYKYKQFTQKQKNKFWKKLQNKLKKENRKIKTD